MDILFEPNINGYEVYSVIWNILLALFPCFIVYHIVVKKKWKKFKRIEKFSFIVIFLIWLVYFPNTAYLFSISRRLVNYCSDYGVYYICPKETWIVLFYFIYGLIGVPTFYYALNRMTGVFVALFNKKLKIIFPILIIPFTSLGLILGLFERYNTGDLLHYPLEIIGVAFSYFADRILIFNFLIFTLSLYLVYYGVEYFIWKMIKK